jgi:pimeloyl-ACP methyl ester carboxylesterase
VDFQIAVSSDGGRIAYEVAGSGPAVVLLHGGGQDCHVWRKTGWIHQLTGRFQVVAIDIRGHGQSSKPTNSAAYHIDQLCDDILCVADAAGVSRFSLWGYSYGGNIGRYLAARSQRVERFAMIGVSFGPSADESFREMIHQMQTHWKPILDAEDAGALDIGDIPEQDRSFWLNGQVRVMLAWLGALLDWPPIEPADMQCPTLWLVGTSNASAMRGVKSYQGNLNDTRVRLALVERLTHSEELERVDLTLPELLRFMGGE